MNASSSPSDHQQLLEALENNTLDIIDNLNQLSIMIEKYDSKETKPHWFEMIEKLDQQYTDLLSLCHSNATMPLMQEQYPYELLQVIDKNESPDQYLQTVKKKSQQRIEYANGKKSAVDQLRNVLREELEKHFPETTEDIVKKE
ncbi:hypothetical protein FDP41_003781 [Naegleria fowleri]|uniref:Mediator of RNA polymerase II transcription subunit 10 n=1 Tax=Naegleria fowleri TaxID=5763 RepID=A0A6A5BSY3_NAEFO|nr:uncharacterized protein FDP41_003781 [Naegleria fowleri]KAF0977128.1 hypothetical protein FDP41_003781 [Naegleria fowleri]